MNLGHNWICVTGMQYLVDNFKYIPNLQILILGI